MNARDFMPVMPRGGAAKPEVVRELLQPLADLVLAERGKLGFSPTLRGWCYLLEGLHAITKGEFKTAEGHFTKMRKIGLLPLDITAVDESRVASGGSFRSDPLPDLLRSAIEDLPWLYSSTTFEDIAGLHLEMVVEKLDLVGMLKQVGRDFGMPITCSRGSADMHSRAAILRRCAKHARNVVLLFGDHDPGGLSITDAFEANLGEVQTAAGIERMPNIEVVRVGLNFEDIERLGLVWIDGLETGSGGDLASPKHTQHLNANVQNYIAQFGARKCEANALLRVPDAADRIVRDVLRQIVPDSVVAEFAEVGAKDRRKAAAFAKRVLKAASGIR